MAPRVAIIGGGIGGVTALKTFVQDGFDVTLYESRGWVGGLWKPDTDESLSALETTSFNSSKYRISTTDFSMSERDFDDFPRAGQLWQYFQDYVDHFQLRYHLALNTKATELARSGDKWALSTIKDGKAQPVEYFDKVAMATGVFTRPKFPKLDGIELFVGPNDHCVRLHDPAQYKGQRVLMVGLHASAQDTVAALSPYAEKIYAAHRSGLTLMPRYGADGAVYDKVPPLWFQLILFYLEAFSKPLFTWIMDSLLGIMSKKAYPNLPASWGLSPAPSLAVTTPLIADEIYPHLESGFCEPVKSVRRFTGRKTVELEDGRILDGIDSVIYCTGYRSTIPFKLPEDIQPYPKPGEPSVWYRHILPIHSDAKVRNSLCMLGHGAIAMPGFCQFEAQSQAVSQIWQGNSSLPPLAEMKSWHEKYMAGRAATAKKYDAKETFYGALLPMGDYASWLDNTAGLGIRAHFGLLQRWTNSCAWSLWWNDRELWNICLRGLNSPAIYALFDMNKRKPWKGAREQIFKDNAAANLQQEKRWAAMQKDGKVA